MAEERATILVVDDETDNIDILREFLSMLGYEAHGVTTGLAARNFVASTPPDVILLDLMLPDESGLEICRAFKNDAQTHHIPVIIISGMQEEDVNIHAIEAGADEFLSKPFDSIKLRARITSCLRAKRLSDEIVQHKKELESRVQARTRQIDRTKRVTVFSLAKLAESRDNETGHHIKRVACYCKVLAETMAMMRGYADVITPAFVQELYDTSPLHDIGKVGIPDQILLKPGKLTKDEFDLMKTHTIIGGDTLHAADVEAGDDNFLRTATDIAYYHHERWDGKGYPTGLEAEAIPLPARILAVADVYDALSSKRPYKNPFSHEKSKAIVLEGDGTQFDSDVIKAFRKSEDAFLDIRGQYADADDGVSALHRMSQKIASMQSNAS